MLYTLFYTDNRMLSNQIGRLRTWNDRTPCSHQKRDERAKEMLRFELEQSRIRSHSACGYYERGRPPSSLEERSTITHKVASLMQRWTVNEASLAGGDEKGTDLDSQVHDLKVHQTMLLRGRNLERLALEGIPDLVQSRCRETAAVGRVESTSPHLYIPKHQGQPPTRRGC